MDRIIGKWAQIEGQPYPGLAFSFFEDGHFEAEYDAMGITSSGTYSINRNQIEMDQTQHSFGLVGLFYGCFEINENLLKLNVVAALGNERPNDLAGAVIYKKIVE